MMPAGFFQWLILNRPNVSLTAMQVQWVQDLEEGHAPATNTGRMTGHSFVSGLYAEYKAQV